MGHESLRHGGRGRVQATLPSPPSNPCFSVECGFPGVDSQLKVEAGGEEGESGERGGGRAVQRGSAWTQQKTDQIVHEF